MINIAVKLKKKKLRIFEKNRRFFKFRLATPVKYVVKFILKFLQNWKFDFVVKHQAPHSEVTGSNPVS